MITTAKSKAMVARKRVIVTEFDYLF